MNEPIERFCSHCGVSLVPLDVLHTSSPCGTCGKTRHYVRSGEGGKGVQIEAGETVTIPADLLRMSFNPQLSSGKLHRAGVPFLLNQLFMAGMPGQASELAESVSRLCEKWTDELQRSDKLAGLDLKTERDAEQAVARLEGDKGSWEWYMLAKGSLATLMVDAIGQGDSLKAAHAGLYTGLTHGLSVVSEPQFEEMVWRGYLAERAIHESSSAADHVPGEAEALAELDPLFQRIGEATLRTWIDSNSPIGPRIGVAAIPEPLLVARAKWHLECFKREREEQGKRPAEGRAKSEHRLKWLTFWITTVFGAGAIGHVVTKLAMG